MLVITKIEVLETPNNFIELQRMVFDKKTRYVMMGDDPVDVEVLKECVRGHRYVHPETGTDILIGVSDGVGKILGIQFDAIQKLKDDLAHAEDGLCCAKNDKRIMKNLLIEISKCGLWKRIKYMIFGPKVFNVNLRFLTPATAGRRERKLCKQYGSFRYDRQTKQ